MLNESIYHRVYQLVKRNIDLRVIASTLNLPLRTVLNVIARIEKSELGDTLEVDKPGKPVEKPQKPAFLDTYFVPRNRYAVLQFVGFVVKEMKEKIDRELLAAKLSTWKIIAIQLTDVAAMDETSVQKLLDYCMELKSKDRYIAILDPSPAIESLLSRFEGKIPVFGTTWAFEEEALSSKNTPTAFRPKNRGLR